MGVRAPGVGGIVAGFLAMQVGIITLDLNGPFVDESLYIVAGLRVLEGHALADGYLTWFNGSPFVWPVVAAVGYEAGGLAGARLIAALCSAGTLLAFAKTAEQLFGTSVARWAAVAFAVNGLFMALAHFAVYDVVALTALAVSTWCVTHTPMGAGSGRRFPREASLWLAAGGVAFAGAVIAKYGHGLMAVPLLGLLVSAHGVERAGRALAVFLAVAGGILGAYFWLFLGAPIPASSAAYFQQTFGRSRGHIAVLQLVFGIIPCTLAAIGAFVTWRSGRRLLAVTCVVALAVFPAFHLWTANFVSGQKHVVVGFLFGYLLAGVALERLWRTRVWTAVGALTLVALWGAAQCYWQDRSWSDTRALARHLVQHVQPGDRIVAESPWNFALALYPPGLIEAPTDVIDANHAAPHDRDVCRIPWLLGHPDSSAVIRDAVARCPHERVLSSTTPQYYFDTTRLRLSTHPATVWLYRLPKS